MKIQIEMTGCRPYLPVAFRCTNVQYGAGLGHQFAYHPEQPLSYCDCVLSIQRSSKWAAIAKCSPDSALRDINDLIERGVLKKAEEGGRSTSYKLVV